MNGTHLLQSEIHVQYFDSFVCSGDNCVKIRPKKRKCLVSGNPTDPNILGLLKLF